MKNLLPHVLTAISLFLVASFCVTCASISKQEQDETLERLLMDEEGAAKEGAAKEKNDAEDSESMDSGSEPTEVANAPPPIVESVGVRPKPAPNLQQPARMDLPLPRGVVRADLFHFINAHADVIAAYQPLTEEWKLYARIFAAGGAASVDEIAGLRARVRENLARSHWLFVWGIFQASGALMGQNSNLTLLVDRQQDFIERMNVLVFLAAEMQEAGMKTNHHMDPTISIHTKKPILSQKARQIAP